MVVDGADEFGEAMSFAELVADTALSFLDPPGPGVQPTLVEQIVAGALSVIPGTFAASIVTVDRDNVLQSPLAVGAEVGRLVMQAQNDTSQGPCLDALRDGKQVVTGDLDVDVRWPLFAARVEELGVRVMICTPMEAAGRRLGALTLISRTTEFLEQDSDTAVMATVFAAHAAVALTGARQVSDMNAALTHRDLIGQAKGILMERFKVTPDIAFATLVRASSVTNLKLRQVCERLCDTGVLLPGMDPAAHSGLSVNSRRANNQSASD